MKETKEILIHTEYITLQQALKLADIIEDGGQSKEFIRTNKILVDGINENRRGRKLYDGAKVEISNVCLLIKNENKQN